MQRQILHLAPFHVVLLFLHGQRLPVGVDDSRQLVHGERCASIVMTTSTGVAGVNDIALLL